MNKVHRSMMFILFLLFGMLLSLQFRSIILSQTEEGFSVKELSQQLEVTKSENLMLVNQLDSIESELELLKENIGAQMDNQQVNQLLRERNYEYLRAGLTTVRGRGIVVTMQDAPAAGEMDIEEYIIHDNDVNGILNELKANGAQAISINDERVISTTKPVCAGPTIIVNDSRYPSPYVIKAIGNPDVLYETVQTMAQVAFMRLADIRIDIVKKDEIIIDRYHVYRSFDKTFKGLEVVTR